jgi:hypothetical protein
MTPEIEAIVEEFALVHMDAHKNPQCQLNAKGAEECKRVSGECAERMRRVKQADSALINIFFKNRFEELPEPAKRFVEAELDRGCVECWTSSSRGPHPDHGDVCNVKIANWFKCRTELIRFGAENLLNRSAE